MYRHTDAGMAGLVLQMYWIVPIVFLFVASFELQTVYAARGKTPLSGRTSAGFLLFSGRVPYRLELVSSILNIFRIAKPLSPSKATSRLSDRESVSLSRSDQMHQGLHGASQRAWSIMAVDSHRGIIRSAMQQSYL